MMPTESISVFHSVDFSHPVSHEPTIRQRLGLDLIHTQTRLTFDTIEHFRFIDGTPEHPFDPPDPFRTIKDTAFFVDWAKPLPFRLFEQTGIPVRGEAFRVLADQREAAEWSRVFGLDAAWDWDLSSVQASVMTSRPRDPVVLLYGGIDPIIHFETPIFPIHECLFADELSPPLHQGPSRIPFLSVKDDDDDQLDPELSRRMAEWKPEGVSERV